MTTVCLFVDDIHDGVATLQRAIGLIDQRPAAFRAGPGISAVFCRVHPKYAVAPTFLELTSQAPPDQNSDDLGVGGREETTAAVFPMREIGERQGPRPIKWHATELAMTDDVIADLARHLDGLHITVGYFPPDRTDRYYVAGNPASPTFDPSVDGGLYIEATKLSHLGLSEEALTATADIPPDSQRDAMIRVVGREYLVDDLDAVLSALQRNLRWEPSSITEEEGFRRAVMPFSAPRSAQLELLQPTGRGRVADAYEELGPGAWTVRISVADVAAKAKDLAERGTPHVLERGLLRPDPAATLSVPFEFVAA
jgi:hypothetical protein